MVLSTYNAYFLKLRIRKLFRIGIEIIFNVKIPILNVYLSFQHIRPQYVKTQFLKTFRNS